MAKLVSAVYGDALFETTREAGRMDEMVLEADVVLTILRENTDLEKLMEHPNIDKEEKVRFLERIFFGRISMELVSVMRLLVEKNHYRELPKVLEYLIQRVKEAKGIGSARVTSAFELTDGQKQAIKQKLLETTGYRELEMSYQVDSALIGGLVIRIGDRVADSSIRTRLYRLTRELSKIQLKAGENTP